MMVIVVTTVTMAVTTAGDAIIVAISEISKILVSVVTVFIIQLDE